MQMCCENLEHYHQLVPWQVGVAEVNSTPFQGMEAPIRSPKGKELWKLLFLSVIWHIWKERNARCIEGTKTKEEISCDKIKFSCCSVGEDQSYLQGCNTSGPVTGARLFSRILYLIFLMILRIIGTHSLWRILSGTCVGYTRLLVVLGIRLACEKEIIKN